MTAKVDMNNTDLNAADQMYVGRALLKDDAKEFSYSLSPQWTENCEGQYDRNLLDLTELARNED
jgi:hypothetical protein